MRPALFLATLGFALSATTALAQGDMGGDFGGFDPGTITFGPDVVAPDSDVPLNPDVMTDDRRFDREDILGDLRIEDLLLNTDRENQVVLHPRDPLFPLQEFMTTPDDGLAALLQVPPEFLRSDEVLNQIIGRPGIMDPSPIDPSRFPLNPIDWVLMPAGPDDAGVTVLGNFGKAQRLNRDLVMPPAVEQLGTPEQRAYAAVCGAAVDAFLPQREYIYSGCVGASGEARDQCVALLNAYVQSCLADPNFPIESQPETVRAATLASDSQVEKIKQTTGVLFQPGVDGSPGQIYCTAVQINERLVATARHCLFREGTASEQASGANRRDVAAIRFFTFAAPTTAITFSGVIEPQASAGNLTELPYVLAADYVFLIVASPAPVQVRVGFSEPAVNDSLILFSYQIAARLAAQLEQSVADDALISDGSWRKFMRYDSTAACQVAELPDPSCVVHACQTEVASSGAPLLRLSEDGSLNLLGIQVRHVVVTDDGPCADKDRASTPNIGVWPAPEDRAVAEAN